MAMPARHTVKYYFRVDNRDISFLRFVLEGYDGLAVLTTREAASGKVVLAVAPGCETDVAAIVRDLRSDMLIEPDNPPKIDEEQVLLY